ncbi:MAG: U32 family peptidase [Mogibacterium sp.]|nr:U32 family peptidase [Mogibacterium sp.]
MNKPELLAPVGGKPHLIAAVNNGADAVYMGGMAFNARIFADNFSDEELPDAINYAHAHGVKVYMTINTLVNDGELARAFEYCNYIYGTGVDGVIIQDFGLARLLRKYLPDLPLHLSTQGTLYNTEAADTVSKLGFSRVVPARELSLAEITELAGHCRSLDDPMDVEVFVHGALCMCYSGQCQMSRVTGGGSGRTGNRGTCAQPCRHAYTDEKGNTYYALSPKDLCLIERIPDLVMSGASSFKIEGRMKSPEYVAIVTRTYRKYIDLFDRLVREHGEEAARDMYSVDEDDMLELRQIFNRGDFTEGYIDGNPGEDILSGASPKNQGLYLGRVIAVIDSEDKVSEKDERSAARGALRRGKELVCIGLDSSAKELGIGIENSDGLEFRSEDRDYLVNSPVGNVCTYIKDLGDGCILTGDFDRGVMTGDLAFKVTDRKLMDKALDAPERRLPATIQFTAREGQFPVLVMTDVRADCSVETVADHRIERAEKAATDPERVENSLRRLGDTVYDPGLTGIDIQMDEGIMMPLSVVNRMRREAADELLEKRLSSTVSGRSPKLSRERIEEVKEAEGLGTSVLDTAAMERRLKKSGRQPVPVEEFMKIRDEGGELPEGVLPYILNISRGNLDAFIESRFGDIAEACRDTGILIGNTGWIERFSEAGVKVYGDYGLNVYNRQAELAYEELGAELYMPSHETGISDGRGIPLMVTEHPVSASALTDRKGVVHKVTVPPSGDKTLIY